MKFCVSIKDNKLIMNKKQILSLTLIFFLFLSHKISAQTIEKFELSGIDEDNHSSIIANLSIKVGDEINENTSDQIIQDIFSSGSFEDIQISISEGIVSIKIVQNPKIESIKVSGYSKKVIEQKDVKEKLINYNLQEGDIYKERNIFNFENNLKELYAKKGFLNFSTTQEIKVNKDGNVDIKIKIKEGKQVMIRTLEIEGLESYSKEEILKILNIGVARSKLASFFSVKNKYEPNKLQEELKKIAYFYQNRGYYDVYIEELDADISDDKLYIDIRVKINEGVKYNLGDIKLYGDLKDKNENELLALFEIKSGELFNRDKLTRGIDEIRDVYANSGYAYIEVTTSTFINDDNNIVVELTINPNNKLYINKINIDGNERTKYDVIYRSLVVREGSLYSLKEVSQSIVNLQKLGFFSTVKVDKELVEDSDDLINLNFSVKERKTGNIGFGLSHSESNGFSLTGSLQERNLFGNGNSIRLEAKHSKTNRELDLFFRNPYINEKQHSFSYSLFLDHDETEQTSSSSYKLDNNGFNVGYGIPINDELRLSARLEYLEQDLFCGDSYKNTYEKEQCSDEVRQKNDEVILGFNVNHNSLNSYINPTSGQENNLNVNISLPYEYYKYYKIDATHRSYSKLSDKLTLKLVADVGLVEEYDDSSVPFYKRYYTGGKSLRGFKSQTISPYYEDSTQLKGGNFKFTGSVNIVGKPDFIEDSDDMRISGFVDFGNVYEDFSLDLKELRMSTGVSFYYLSPVGGIGVYLSTPIVKKDGDETQSFAFYLDNEF